MSLDVTLSIWIDGNLSERLEGSLLWTHFGVSGPVVLNASRHWERAVVEGRRVAVTVNFLGAAFDEAERQLWRWRPNVHARRFRAPWRDGCLRRLRVHWSMRSVCSGRRPLPHLTRDDRRRLAHALTEWPLADHRFPRLQLRRSNGWRRLARRDPVVDDGVTRSVRVSI